MNRWGRPHRGLLAFVAVVLTVVAAAPALAATVSVQSGQVVYVADTGERNEVTVNPPDASSDMLIADAAATLVAGASCDPVDAHSVRCRVPPDIPRVQVDLGDGNDLLRAVPTQRPGLPPNPTVFVVANAGPGDDLVDLREVIGYDLLDGGGGRDELYAGAGDDTVTDGDLDGAPAEAAPGPDVLDGGGDSLDAVSYAQRTASVAVDLLDPAGDGAPGEGDTVRGVRSILGGGGDDLLAGDDGRSYLAGGPGRDRLVGRGGGDFLGIFIARGPDGNPPPPASAAGDAVRCGDGYDVVGGRGNTDFTPASCEMLLVRRAENDYTNITAYPDVDPPRPAFGFICRDPEFSVPKCSGFIELRRTTGEVLARGRIPENRTAPTVRLRVTPLGRRLARRPGGVIAAVTFRGRNLPLAGWTIRFRLPIP
jgi:hypothetical protein